MTEEAKNRIYSTLLAAYLAPGNQTKVGLYVDYDSGPYCSVQIGKIGSNF